MILKKFYSISQSELQVRDVSLYKHKSQPRKKKRKSQRIETLS